MFEHKKKAQLKSAKKRKSLTFFVKATTVVAVMAAIVVSYTIFNRAFAQKDEKQSAQSATPAQAEQSELKKRVVPLKPERTDPSELSLIGSRNKENKESKEADRIIVKFREGANVELRSAKELAAEEIRSKADHRLLERAGVNNNVISTDLSQVNALAEQYAAKFKPLFKESKEELRRQKAEAEAKSGEEQGSLDQYFSLELEKEWGAAVVADVIDQLNALSSVEIAYVQPEAAEPPQADITPVTPSYESSQGYLNAASSGGIDARYAWTISGGKGQGVKIIDIERGWTLNHEDLKPAFFVGGTMTTNINDVHHGTAVLGEMVGAENGYGVTGIVSGAAHGVSSSIGIGEAAAINTAANNLRAGDLILIEAQFYGPKLAGETCQYDCLVPVEYQQAEFDAIKAATGRGIVVVEAAGNGAMNLDDARYNKLFDRSNRDSGAIIVGAGEAYTRRVLSFSNYGSRVDVQGFGDSVSTLGYEDRLGTGDIRQFYRYTFNGTSSASPIVTGAAAAIQGVLRARSITPLTSAQMRFLLRSTGTAQAANTKQIGPLPNLRAAIDSLPTAGKYYQLVARHSGKCADVKGGSLNDGARLGQYDCGTGYHQQFKLEATGDGYYKLTARHSNKVIDVAGDSLVDGGYVHQWSYLTKPNQQWKLEAVGDNYYKLTARHSGKALDVSGISMANSAFIQQWTYKDQTNQQWLFRLMQ